MFKLQRKRAGAEPGRRTTSIYRTAAGRAAIMAWYDRKLAALPVHAESRLVSTSFGPTRLVVAGPPDAPPVVVLHGMQMNAAMVAALVTLSRTHRVYAIVIIGMPGKSAEVRLAGIAEFLVLGKP